MYHAESIRALNHLDRIKKDLVGGTLFTLGGLSVDIQGKDSIGNLIQEWLGVWFTTNGYDITRGDKTQDYPDFDIGDKEYLLEVKVFNSKKPPAFDIANFEAYCASLAKTPSRLLSDYLILSYSITDHCLKIENVWLKKIWEITGASCDYPLRCQVKYRNRRSPNETFSIDNIRPVTWYSNNARATAPFKNSEEFVDALYDTQLKYRGHSSQNAFEMNLNS